MNANGSAQLTLWGIAANCQGIKIRRDREHLLLICYGKWLDALRTELQESIRQSTSIRTGGRIYLPSFAKAVFSAEFNKFNIRYAFVTEMA